MMYTKIIRVFYGSLARYYTSIVPNCAKQVLLLRFHYMIEEDKESEGQVNWQDFT